MIAAKKNQRLTTSTVNRVHLFPQNYSVKTKIRIPFLIRPVDARISITICNSPSREPIEMFPFPIIALHSERDVPEVNERCGDSDVGDCKDD